MPRHFRTHLASQLAEMHPANFALVMATGIVAIGASRLGLRELSAALAWVNWVAYPALWALLIARVAVFPGRVAEDLRSHQRAHGFFTVVAATAVLGAQAVLLHGADDAARVLWWVALALWAACTYAVFGLLAVREDKPDLGEGINGGWLLAVVATESIAVLGCLLPSPLADRDAFLFLLLCFWLGGGMLYLWIIGLIFYRYMFFRFSPRDLMPPYWISMGAVAIGALAGAGLSLAAPGSALLAPLRPFLDGLTVMFWATATWWIPMLVVLGIWRHRVRGVRVVYDPLYWGLVFPLGMYATSSARMAEALGAPFLLWIARGFVVAALCAWFATFLGLAGRLLRALVLRARRPRAAVSPAPSLAPVPPLGGLS